ncbi:MAG TPA: bifunctional glutamate N-acetyltransferase/amino-acid acetyltransferase ArgJ [Candidatus Xenobia bacterium]|nr:bifunctional glutamate N-acetyltransferase/amino-acid acetyltransferase ArgJ [Candidatus Xenobia bacterium]
MTSRSLRVPRGFRFAGVAAGIKQSGRPDLGLVEVASGATAAAVFTSNRVKAAPLHVGRRHLQRARGRLRALVVNSGNANCATGTAGLRAAEQTCRAVAHQLGLRPHEAFPASTGVIGVRLPVKRILAALPELRRGLSSSSAAVRRFARAIMTTDTRPKLAGARFDCGSARGVLLGIAKGAGMIHPRLAVKRATMLVYLFTDVAATPAQLGRLLRNACARTFNRISVDGDTSTNDTVLLLASGASGLRVRRGADEMNLAAALEAVCASLAKQIVSDGEGVRHVVELRVEGARTEAEAEQVARSIANSPLVKTAWAGADPNWGRILAAVGNSGVAVDPGRVDIFFGHIQVCRRGAAWPFNDSAAHRYLSRREFRVRVRLGCGRAGVRFWTCDLTKGYIQTNAEYRT